MRTALNVLVFGLIFVLKVHAQSVFPPASGGGGGGSPTGAAGGFLTGTYPNPTSTAANVVSLFGTCSAAQLLSGAAVCANGLNLSGAAAPTLPATTTFYSIGASGANSRELNLAYGGTAFFTNARLDGTPASPTALLADEQIGGYNAFGCAVAPCSAIAGPVASLRTFAKTGWTGSNTDSYIDITTTPTGSLTAVARGRIENDGGLLWPPTVTGGSQGPGSINAAALYINGVAVTAGGDGGLTINSTPISGGGTNAILYGDGTKLQNATGVTRSAAGTFTFTTSVISPLYTGAGAIKFQPGTDSTTAMQFGNAAGTAFVTMDSTNKNVIFSNSGTSTGKVTFSDFSISSTFYGISFATVPSSTNYAFLGDGTNTFFNTGGFAAFRTSNADQARLLNNGNFLIGGTTDGNYRLDVQKSGSSGTARFYDATATTGLSKVLCQDGAGQSTTACLQVASNGGTSNVNMFGSGKIHPNLGAAHRDNIHGFRMRHNLRADGRSYCWIICDDYDRDMYRSCHDGLFSHGHKRLGLHCKRPDHGKLDSSNCVVRDNRDAFRDDGQWRYDCVRL